MLRLLNRVTRFNFANFQLGQFKHNDYRTICGLLKEKYFLNNDEIQTTHPIKLIDDANNTLGIFQASEARKKANNLGLDMILINGQSVPLVCKVTGFRSKMLHKFYEEIVVKRNEKLITKATTTKNIKISTTLNQNETKVKLRQILELTKKNLKVRVYMTCKQSNRQECLERLQSIKSEVQNKCYIEEDISNKRYEDEDKQQDEQEDVQQKKFHKLKQKTQTYSFIIKARENDFVRDLLQQGTEIDPQKSVELFLKNYYKQQDSQMMDIKVSQQYMKNSHAQIMNKVFQKQQVQKVPKVQKVSESSNPQKDKRVKRRPKQRLTSNYKTQPLIREAQARIMNMRLKQLLNIY